MPVTSFFTIRYIRKMVRLMALSFGILTILSSCSYQRAPRVFSEPDYSYLRKMHLNVSSINIEDHSKIPLSPDDITAQSPLLPALTLTHMIRSRFIPTGSMDKAIFVIDKANLIRKDNKTLTGEMIVHLNLVSQAGQTIGVAEAQVYRTVSNGTEGRKIANRTDLYNMVNQMLKDMNVELEYQIYHNLKQWLVDAGGSPLDGSIKSESLEQPAPPTTIVTPPFLPQEDNNTKIPAPNKSSGNPSPLIPNTIYPIGPDDTRPLSL